MCCLFSGFFVNIFAIARRSVRLPHFAFHLSQALAQAVQAGIIPVVAAGNSAADACGYWPAQSVSAITVGATDINDYRSSFSNYGSCVAQASLCAQFAHDIFFLSNPLLAEFNLPYFFRE